MSCPRRLLNPAVKVSGLPVRPDAVAVTVSIPGIGPKVKEVKATPWESVVD
jgi:hypothetical protein